MATFQPKVLEDVTLLEAVQYFLDRHAPPSRLVVCSTRQQFQDRLYHLLEGTPTPSDWPPQDSSNLARLATEHKQHRLLSKPSLRLLSSLRTLELIFCPSVAHLRAFLATVHVYSAQVEAKEDDDLSPGQIPMLAVLDPIRLHEHTSSFSAQGLNRTFSIAVDAASAMESTLIMAESSDSSETHMEADTAFFQDELPSSPQEETTLDRWEAEIPMLNVRTKSFGPGSRGWVGRTVKVRQVAGRWCSFERLSR